MQRKYPNAWEENNLINSQISPSLSPQEKLRTIFNFQIDHTSKGKSNLTFIVIEQQDKAIGRLIVNHLNQEKEGFCQGHATQVVAYPIEDIDTLISEYQTFAEGFSEHIREDSQLTPNTNIPKIILNVPKSMPNELIALKMLLEITETKNPELKQSLEIILRTLNLIKLPEENTQEQYQLPPVATPEIQAQIEKDKKLTNLESAAKEMELIEKYGKAKMEKLAKQMHFNGKIINNTSTNQ